MSGCPTKRQGWIVLPKGLELIKESGVSCPNVRDLIEQAVGNNSFKSLFWALKKISCVTVPRDAISKDVLQTIDHCKQ